jgi:hypothetical protein
MKEKKYKIGDQVILQPDLDTSQWGENVAEQYDNLNPKIATIGFCDYDSAYQLEEIDGLWDESEIIELCHEPEPIDSRFEILDL